MNTTYIQAAEKVSSYDEELLTKGISDLFHALGVQSDLHPGMKVLIRKGRYIKQRSFMENSTFPRRLRTEGI